MIGFDEAVALTAAAARPLGTERTPLRAAAGRVLAAPVTARVDSPPTTVSAMDGYAVREADLADAPASLRVVGESFAGAGFAGEFGPGECVRIFTGAPAPAGADRVVIQELVERDGDRVRIEAPPSGARHLRAQGSDFRAGDTLLERGRRLTPTALVAAAGADVGELELHRRPRVAVLSTGDELAEPGAARDTPGAIPESVSFGVAALAEVWGGDVVGARRLRDDPASMTTAAAEALADADLVVVTGGASVGEKDFAKVMFEPAGLELIFAKVAIKPGKPVWLGRAGGRLVLGLPGNPTSAMVTGRLFMAPLLAGLGGREPGAALAWREAALAGALGPTGDRETFHRGARAPGARERVAVLGDQGSSAQRALAQADVLIRRRAGAPAAAEGEPLEVLDL